MLTLLLFLMLLQEINIQNMNVELVAQMFKNYQSNVLFHLEGIDACLTLRLAINVPSYRQSQRSVVMNI